MRRRRSGAGKSIGMRIYGMAGYRALAPLLLAGTALVASCAVLLHFLDANRYERFVGGALFQCAVYALAVWFVLSRRWNDRALRIILITAILARAIALLAPDALSTDVYRYIWDGRVQAAGINPYRYVPGDPALSVLRDEDVYPNINRSEYAPTIYPPVAQMIFFLATRVQEAWTAMKLAMIGFEALTIAAIFAWLRRGGRPPRPGLFLCLAPSPFFVVRGGAPFLPAAAAFLVLCGSRPLRRL